MNSEIPNENFAAALREFTSELRDINHRLDHLIEEISSLRRFT